MFEHFTFGAVSQTRHDETVASPTDISFAAPQTSFPFSPDSIEDLGDIVHQFSKQSLTREERVREFAAWGEATNRPLEVDSDEEMSPLAHTTSAPAHAYSAPAGGSLACRRLQRQMNTQLQLSTTHMRDLSTLVEDMITSNSQCTLKYRSHRDYMRSPTSSSRGLSVDPIDNGNAPKSIDMDEGFCDAEPCGEEEMSLRRASAPNGIRKTGQLRWERSADISIGGRAKIRTKTRMRKRSTVAK